MAADSKLKNKTKRQISKAYNDALQKAIRDSRDYFRTAQRVNNGKIKPPPGLKTEKQIAAWKEGYLKRAARKAAVVETMAADMAQAGVTVRKRIQSTMVTLYQNQRKTVTRLLDKTVKANLPELSRKKIAVLLYGKDGESGFTKIAFNRLESDYVVRQRLRHEFAQSIGNGETQEQLLSRIMKVTGRERNDAMRILRTESTHVDSLAKQQTAYEHFMATGIKPRKRWVCIFHNSRDSHMQLHNQVVDIDQKFPLPSGGYIDYPGDSSAGAAEVVNCQCYLEILPGKKNGESTGTINLDLQMFAEKDLKKQRLSSLEKGIESLEAKIHLHEDKIKNPGKYVGGWEQKSKQEQDGIKRHWEKEINTFKKGISERTKEIDNRGGA